MTGLMQGKRGLIMGLANDKSLAWGISKKLAEHGAQLAFTYQGDALEKRVRPLAEQLGSDIVLPCDVSDMDNLDTAFASLKEHWDTLDFVVDVGATLNHDEHLWAPVIRDLEPLPDRPRVWDAARDFAGPPPERLSRLEQLAQVLVMANEAFFID